MLIHCSTAYWIAFGPHGPRALPPPGENTKIFTYTMIGVAVSGLIFGITRHFAGPKPRTMTKEYEEATNEYLKVSPLIQELLARRSWSGILILYAHRITRSNPSAATAAKATWAKAKCRVRLGPKNRLALSTRLPTLQTSTFPRAFEACRDNKATGWRRCLYPKASLYRHVQR